ncbi:MAG: VCBS repeat-containing protein [Bacteroidia bacterium]
MNIEQLLKRTTPPGLLLAATLGLLLSCQEKTSAEAPAAGSTLFTTMPTSYTGVDFSNALSHTEAFNPYTYRNFYNGGGVGIGDLNNDGLPDLYFCGNLVPNKLYLNRGDLRFEDITTHAGVASKGVWSSGVSLADINGDGWLDIYVCKSGAPGGDNRHNELFLNNADPDAGGRVTFTEAAAAWGIDDLGLSSHAAFFDYDGDGDLDCYLLNNSIRSVGGYDLIPDQRSIRDTLGGNKLYRHDGDHYTDVSEAAGIYGSMIGFGLGVSIGDLDRDGWPDIYVSNDFFERDYLYLNQGDGTFREALEAHVREISLSSMGADVADLNGDGWPEIFVTDMLPRDDARMKTKTAFENWDKYSLNLRQGYYRQFTRNVLQLNDGSGNFSEVGRMTGVYATDWSWGALILDLDNDGLQDIFVANGIYKDLTDQDFINFYASPQAVREMLRKEGQVIQKLIDAMPSQALPNYAFVQQPGGGHIPVLADRAAELGLAAPSFSNGSAYGDLDNDGDPDLVVNNVNMPAFIYRNESSAQPAAPHWIALEMVGDGMNRFGLGCQVSLWAGGRLYYREVAPMRGFQSTVDYRLLIGLGSMTQIDSLHVRWPGGNLQRLGAVPIDGLLRVFQRDARPQPAAHPAAAPAPFEMLAETLPYTHREEPYQDFARDRLLYHMRSAEGPCLCQGDVNGDGRADLYLGGAHGQPGSLLVQQRDGSFAAADSPDLRRDSTAEDSDCIFFDADGDGDPDLYVASGSSEFPASSSALLDRLYINDGRGGFSRSPQPLPILSNFVNTACVRAADVDGDGDQDLFVGARMQPALFGVPADGYLLLNDGRGNFSDATAQRAAGLRQLGMICDATWADYDGDGDSDLLVVGEWMPLVLLRNDDGTLHRAAAPAEGSEGWWNAVLPFDADDDGDTDFALGNHGLNTRFRATPDRPMRLYVNDFDRNGSAEHILTVYNGAAAYPLVLRHDLVTQLPFLKKKYLKYEAYREQTIDSLFTPEQLQGSIVREARYLESAVLLNQGAAGFELRALPAEAQIAPVYALLAGDFDGDGHADLLLGGNFFRAKPETGIYAASYGTYLRGDGQGGFVAVRRAGLALDGEVRVLAEVATSRGPRIVAARNNASPQVLTYRSMHSTLPRR